MKTVAICSVSQMKRTGTIWMIIQVNSPETIWMTTQMNSPETIWMTTQMNSPETIWMTTQMNSPATFGFNMIMILVRKMGTSDSVVKILLKRLKWWKTIDRLPVKAKTHITLCLAYTKRNQHSGQIASTIFVRPL